MPKLTIVALSFDVPVSESIGEAGTSRRWWIMTRKDELRHGAADREFLVKAEEKGISTNDGSRARATTGSLCDDRPWQCRHGGEHKPRRRWKVAKMRRKSFDDFYFFSGFKFQTCSPKKKEMWLVLKNCGTTLVSSVILVSRNYLSSYKCSRM